MNRHIHPLLRLLVISTCLFLSSHAYAYKLIPLSTQLSPSGKSAQKTFRIENSSEEPIAVELNIYKRKMAINGKDELSEANDDFLLYPAQIIVMPGKSQAIRVRWLGDPKPEKELAYRLIAEQLPVSFNKKKQEGGQVNLLVRFIASIYITPHLVRPDIKLGNYRIIESGSGSKELLMTLVNSGKAHSLLKNPVISIESGGESITLNEQQLHMVSKRNILANHSRQFSIPWPDHLPARDVKVTFSYGQ